MPLGEKGIPYPPGIMLPRTIPPGRNMGPDRKLHHTPVDRMTDMCKNITFLQLHLQVVITITQYSGQVLSFCSSRNREREIGMRNFLKIFVTILRLVIQKTMYRYPIQWWI